MSVVSGGSIEAGETIDLQLAPPVDISISPDTTETVHTATTTTIDAVAHMPSQISPAPLSTSPLNPAVGGAPVQPFFTNPFMASEATSTQQQLPQTTVVAPVMPTIPPPLPGMNAQEYQQMMQQYMSAMFTHAQNMYPQLQTQPQQSPSTNAAGELTDTQRLAQSKLEQGPRTIGIDPVAQQQQQMLMAQMLHNMAVSMSPQHMAAQAPLPQATVAAALENQPAAETVSAEATETTAVEPSPPPVNEVPPADQSAEVTPLTADDSVENTATSRLIKKQMNEIEKEITRRINNQNVKSVDPRDLEDLLIEKRLEVDQLALRPSNGAQLNSEFTPYTSAAPIHTTSALPGLAASFGPLPGQFTAPPATMGDIMMNQQQQQSINQQPPPTTAANQQPTVVPPRHNPFNEPSLSPFHQTYPQSSNAVGMPFQPSKPVPPSGYGAPMQPQAASMLPYGQSMQPQANHMGFNLAQAPLTPQYAAALLQQMKQQQAAPTPVDVQAQLQQHLQMQQQAQAHQLQVAGAAGGATNPQDDWPTNGHHQSNGHGDGEPQLDENGDPIWVMRESYKQRLERDAKRLEKEKSTEGDGEVAPKTKKEGTADSDTDGETDRLLGQANHKKPAQEPSTSGETEEAKKKKEVMVHEPAVLIEGVLFRARYLGSTQLVCDGRPNKNTRMMQAQEAVTRIKAPDGERQPSCDVDLFISTEKIMVLNTDLQRISETDVRQDIMMDHPLRTISYIADIGNVVVLMARRVTQSGSPDADGNESISIRKTPKIICHVFESVEAGFIAQSIGQAFQVAYAEFLRANGIDDPGYLREIDYQEVLNSQEIFGDELEMFSRKDKQKDFVVPKSKGECLGLVIVESGWGSMLPTVVIANLQANGAASRCNQLNIGDQIIAVNGISFVGLQLAACQTKIKNVKTLTAVRMTVVPTPPVVEVRIKRPDTKYQLGFSVQNGVICSLLRGGIAERGGIRVGHRIIEINAQSVVAVPHERIVNMLATAIGEIQMKTMPTSMFRLLTGQETPNYI